MERLDKLVAAAAGLSRKEAGEAIRRGRVSVDGVIQRKPEVKADPNGNLRLDGKPVRYEKYVYYMMNKPAGYLSAREDRGGPTVFDILPDWVRRRDLGAVGRLDKDTEGLLLFTDNGELNHRLTSPKYHQPKQYLVHLDIPAEIADGDVFARGIELSDFTAMPAELMIGEDPTCCLLTIGEGKFHQVKRMFAARGKTVVYLKRLSMGPIRLDETLKPGDVRALSAEEAGLLLEAARLK